MQYIDKQKDKTIEFSFNQIVDSYISRGVYRYDALTEDDRKSLRRLLDCEQNGLCAYCMKRVTQFERTIDHVIPKYIDESRFVYAYRIGKGLFMRNIQYEKKFTSLSIPLYYPHTLSYGNLVLACHSCNEYKDNDIIYPFFFDSSSKDIYYTEKGRMIISPDKEFPRELKTVLNEDFYITYRSLWRAVKLSGLGVLDVQNANDEISRQNLLNRIKDKVSNPIVLKKYPKLVVNFSVSSKWIDFLRYDWFWYYY